MNLGASFSIRFKALSAIKRSIFIARRNILSSRDNLTNKFQTLGIDKDVCGKKRPEMPENFHSELENMPVLMRAI